MIRTGYLRWEIDVQDVRSRDDRAVARGDLPGPAQLPDRAGQAARGTPMRPSGSSAARRRTTRCCGRSTATAARPTCGSPTSARGRSATPRATGRGMPRYWMEKLQREAGAFAHEVVRTAASFPQLVISSPALRAGYARLVAWEIFRVIEGKSQPQPTRRRRADAARRLDLSSRACPSWSPPSWCATSSSPRNSTSSASSTA